MNKKYGNKKLHLELLRIIAIIMVVLNHSDLFYTFYTNTYNKITFWFSLLVSSVCKINVPLFMVITGILLLPKNESIKTLLKKRVLKTIIILVVFSAVIYLLECFVWQIEVFDIYSFGKKLLRAEIQESYWYLYEYVGILLMLPFLGIMARNLEKDIYQYFIIIGIILKLGVPVMNYFVNIHIPFTSFITIDSVFYILLGYYLENYITEDKLEKISYVKLSVSIVFCILFTAILVLFHYRKNGQWSQEPLSAVVPLLVILIFILSKKICNLIQHEKVTEIIELLGGSVFGVYLIERIGQRVFLAMYLGLCEHTYGIIACSIYVMCILIFGFGMVLAFRSVIRFRKKRIRVNDIGV